jgi:hypothetical protein
MVQPVVDEVASKPLSSMDWSTMSILTAELNSLKIKEKPSNEEQVVIDWMQARLDSLELRRKNY